MDARPSSDIKTKLDADLLTALPTLTANDERPAQGPAVLLTPDVIAVVGIILSGAAIALARWVAF